MAFLLSLHKLASKNVPIQSSYPSSKRILRTEVAIHTVYRPSPNPASLDLHVILLRLLCAPIGVGLQVVECWWGAHSESALPYGRLLEGKEAGMNRLFSGSLFAVRMSEVWIHIRAANELERVTYLDTR